VGVQRFCAVVAIGLVACAVPVTKAPVSKEADDVRVTETVQYYEIGGRSVPTLWHNISLRGPRTAEAPFAGHAKWDVRWSYDWRATASGCEVEAADASLSITYTLPKWSGRTEADLELRDKWDRFSLALRLHEEGHGANGRRAAERIRTGLRALDAQSTCDALSAAADALAQRVIEEEAENDRRYDDVTVHGLKQGVVLR
jgi:predicted secreted Zn-dependent protease